MPTPTAPTRSTSYASSGAACSTTELLAAAREGDAAAWDEVVRRYSGVVAAKVRSFRMQDADALDAIQMTWLRLAENVHRLCYPERLAGWLATTACRECLRILRQARSTATPMEVFATHTADPAAGPEQRAVDADTARALGQLIAQLPPTKRVLLRALFAADAGSYTDVAQTVGIPVGSIGPSRARALQQLRWMLVDRGLGPSA
jgi:RNA polymerase sigma factor (sigma-70 family)